ncbi:MAG: ribosome biogenesis factor YjgA [Methylophilaceae bacterium]
MSTQPEIEEEISKTQVKQMMHDLQELGEALVALPVSKLKQIELPENLRDAILEAQRITAHGGKKRQLQYIGKLMRNVEPEPIQQKLDQWNGNHNAETARLHRLENWRQRLIDDDAALPEFLALHATSDIQHIRNLIRNARKEASLSKPLKSSRELFKVLREMMA